MDKIEVGNRLRHFIKQKFSSYELVAAKLGMKSPSLQTYLRGESLPGAEILSKLSDLGCDIEWLLLRKENPGEVSGDENDTIIRKDKIIISQAEELMSMKVKLEELKQKVLELEEDQSRLMTEMGKMKVEKMRGKTSVKKRIAK